MDMWNVYRAVVTKQLPDARIVVDRFHIQRMANNAMEAIRKEIRRSLSQRQRLKLKNDRFVLLKRLHNLKDREAESFRHWCREFPQLAEAHALKEGFLSIWDAKTRPEAEKAFARWANAIPLWLQKTFGTIARTVDTWSEPVFAYWDNPITNAYTEAVNGVAKGMNRLGRGYSFDVLRARLLYNPKARAATAAKIRAPAADSQPDEFTKFTMGRMTNSPSQRVRYTQRVVEYGPSLDVLGKLLAEGAFDDE
jgi:transposase